MALDPRLTATLVCPVCKGAIVWDAEKSLLVCPRCKLAFEVKDNIPNMIPDEAKKLSDEEAEEYAKRLSIVRGA
ncbi:Trm112 family protein [Parasutterella secunda]|jgi:uncharacterized protein YbaR (Trm112 family)|uniref:Trm112 family protein n=1 Tax=Parasutterella secunda TaxID=626947 RepID=UPI001F90E2B0|nr:Trm112 family protein [Parasutterella secunda]HIR21112.1 Trm112 family protein [Candidatus Aphodousia faecalis]HJI93826.1 Trm112 family protein [Sutterellaceae bacterium]MCL1597170.1 Trm112 family protein [Parasutterella secunda]MCR8920873.1 Trm112 family protein [Parasutterella secunda]MDM8088239.1 Trm112 family protein [Parasutterella secunda]